MRLPFNTTVLFPSTFSCIWRHNLINKASSTLIAFFSFRLECEVTAKDWHSISGVPLQWGLFFSFWFLWTLLSVISTVMVVEQMMKKKKGIFQNFFTITYLLLVRYYYCISWFDTQVHFHFFYIISLLARSDIREEIKLRFWKLVRMML